MTTKPHAPLKVGDTIRIASGGLHGRQLTVTEVRPGKGYARIYFQAGMNSTAGAAHTGMMTIPWESGHED